MSHWTYNKFTCVSNGLQQIRNRTVFIKSRLCKITGCTHFAHVNMHLVANDAAICLLSSFVRPFIHTYMASKVRNRHCVTICVHCHSPVRLHCIVFRVNLLGFGSFFLIRALFCELFYWRWLHFDRSHMPFFGGLIFVSPGQLDYPADLSTHSHTCIQINFILYLS